MSGLFTELEASVEPLPEKVPPRQDLWIVLAYNPGGCFGGGWSIPSKLHGMFWETRQAAEYEARKLGERWLHKRIVRIPGEGQ